MRPGSLARRGVGYDELRAINPKIVFCTISGYGMTGPYRDYPSHGVAYDTWAGIVKVATDDEGFTYIPEHVSIGINAGPRLRGARHPGRGDPGPRDRRGLLHRHRAVRRRRRHGLVPLRELPGLRAPRVRGHRATRPTTTSAVRRARPAWSKGCATRSTRPRTASTCSSWRPSRPSGRTSARRSSARDLFERWPGSKYADHARGNRELQGELRAIFLTKTAGGMARVRGAGQHADRAGQHPQDVARRSPVRRPPPPAAGGRGGQRPDLHAAALRRRGTPAPGQGADGGTAHRGRLALGARLRRCSHRHRTRRGAFGTDS